MASETEKRITTTDNKEEKVSRKGLSRASLKRKKNKEKKSKHELVAAPDWQSKEVQAEVANADVLVSQIKEEIKPATSSKELNKSKETKITKETTETKAKNTRTNKRSHTTKDNSATLVKDETGATNKSNDASTSIEAVIEELLREPILSLSDEQREMVTNWYEHQQQGTNISITTCTGVQFQDIKIGRGKLPQKHDVVTFRYIGYLGKLHGSIFDKGLLSTRYAHKEIIYGLEEGIATMRTKGQRLIIIPPHLGYGDVGNEAIPAGSTLAFLVDIVRIGSRKKKLEEEEERESSMPLPSTFLKSHKKNAKIVKEQPLKRRKVRCPKGSIIIK